MYMWYWDRDHLLIKFNLSQIYSGSAAGSKDLFGTQQSPFTPFRSYLVQWWCMLDFEKLMSEAKGEKKKHYYQMLHVNNFVVFSKGLPQL